MGEIRDIDQFGRARADERALADMAPDLSLVLEHRERLAQLRAGQAEPLRQAALGRQSARGLSRGVGDEAPQLVDHALDVGIRRRGVLAEGRVGARVSVIHGFGCRIGAGPYQPLCELVL